MIKKSDLIHGEYYWGDCRNANTARWNQETSTFTYWRIKFGEAFVEDIRHPEDDDGHDLFLPEKIVDWGTNYIPLTLNEAEPVNTSAVSFNPLTYHE